MKRAILLGAAILLACAGVSHARITDRWCIGPNDDICLDSNLKLQVAGDIVAGASVSASGFFGDGSALTNITATDNTKVAKAGDTMTGQLTLAGSTLTITGNAFSVGGSTLAVANGKVGIGTVSPLESAYVVAGNFGGAFSEAQAGRWSLGSTSADVQLKTLFPTPFRLGTNNVIRQIFAATGESAFKTGAGAADTDPSALVRLISTVSGFGLPAMTTVQRDAIASPITGLQIYNISTSLINFFNGALWVDVAAAIPPLTTLSSPSSTDTAALGVADVYRMTTAGTTLTIQTADITEGRMFRIRAIAASVGQPVEIATQGSETIDGSTNDIELTTNHDSVTLYAIGGNLESLQ